MSETTPMENAEEVREAKTATVTVAPEAEGGANVEEVDEPLTEGVEDIVDPSTMPGKVSSNEEVVEEITATPTVHGTASPLTVSPTMEPEENEAPEPTSNEQVSYYL